jgi:D-glycero-D-manno-heptose 1,7-bisphosphate phosphatase
MHADNQLVTNHLVILDRDGVINEDSDDYIKSPEEWIAIESSLPAIAKLNKAGVKVAIATNQSGISRGYFDIETLDAIHQKMHQSLAEQGANIDALCFCPDHPDNPGPFRKPAPGMLNELINQFQANPEQTWFVGDSKSDIDCALNAKCNPALVLTGKGQRTIEKHGPFQDLKQFTDLADFVDWYLMNT